MGRLGNFEAGVRRALLTLTSRARREYAHTMVLHQESEALRDLAAGTHQSPTHPQATPDIAP